ncbi:Tat pathway signal protein [Roseicella aerolata]|uniref:Tat pathway signal protein n=1 Tax=Roseicella aerolata TaxID=2883479 RepID=A0A9X1ILG1_9PROT|nr:Tat pathway signal protein [Roseicella aerolata]MCB4825290.1 Tat pathway signal protein [Roseicella aerolata]
MTSWPMRLPAALLALPVMIAPGLLRAEAPAPPLRLELNRLEPREGGACRVWLVANSAAPEALDPLRLDLVLFGRDGVVARRVAVDIGPLPAGRTQARIFDLAGQPCDGLGSVLLNDVLACGGTEAAARNACAEGAVLASQVDGVTFQK